MRILERVINNKNENKVELRFEKGGKKKKQHIQSRGM